MSKLWYREPANIWDEALPLGNGKLGAMVYGSITTEHIQLNEDSIWYGGPIDRNNPDAKASLQTIRRLILDKQIPEAEALMKQTLSGTPESQRPYQPLGDLNLTFDQVNASVSNYRRTLSLDDAIHTVRYSLAKTDYERETFISAKDNVLVLHLRASRPASISFDARLARQRFYNRSLKIDDQTILIDGNLGQEGLDFAVACRAYHTGGSCHTVGDCLVIRDADSVTLLLAAASNFRYEDPTVAILETLDAAGQMDIDSLRQRHLDDYQALYRRVEFNLSGEIRTEHLSTKERLLLAKDGQMDIHLAKLYFDYGRYLLISSSRGDSLPANLQGIWNEHMRPPWDSKYTININTQMNYWPAEVCNLPECHLPLFDHLKRMLPNGKYTAEFMYGCRGFVAHHNTDIWGDTAVQDIHIPASYWVMGGAWLATHIWMHYDYTRDLDFLAEYYPIMMEAAVFFLDFLIEVDDYLLICPSVSPENIYVMPDGTTGAVTISSTMDNQILRDLFNQYLLASYELNIRDQTVAMVERAIDRIPPTRIGSDGRLMEWMEEYEEIEPGHRHISHLYGLYPSDQITNSKTPELAEAARETLRQRLQHGGGHTGWSRAWIINFYARLQDPKETYYHFEQLITKSTLSNLLDNHPPFQIDGNFGATTAITEMLVSSTANQIILLPALPEAWLSGSIRGLCVRGNATVDIHWENNELSSFHVQAPTGLMAIVNYKNLQVPINLAAGQSASYDRNLLPLEA